MIRHIINFTIIFISLFTSIYVGYENLHAGYNFSWLLPLLYSINYFLYVFILKQKNNYFVILFYGVMFVRYVLLPFLAVYNVWYEGRAFIPPYIESYNLAIALMSYEMIVSFFFLYYWISKIKFSYKSINVEPLSNVGVYIIFILITFLLFLTLPNLHNAVSFINPQEEINTYEDFSNIENIVYFSLYIAKYLSIVVISSYLYKKFNKSKSNFIALLNYIIVIILSLIIFGNNRADFVMSFLAGLLFLQILYKRKVLVLNGLAIFLAPLVVYFISLNRNTFAYMISSDVGQYITDMIQIYFGGIYNVALSTEIKLFNSVDTGVINLIYDTFRPVLGLNIFLQNLDYDLTSYLFNYRIYGTDHATQILPSIGHGYYYFGFLLSPIFLVIFIYLAKKFMEIVSYNSKIDLVFLLLIPITRLSISPMQNISIIFNDLSSILIIFIPLYILNKKISLRKVENKA